MGLKLKVSAEHRDPREAVLTIDLDDAEVEPYLDQAYRQAVRRLNIPGFRKGKAPRRIVEQMFGREYLINEAMDSMIQDVTTKAVDQENLELGGIPSVAIEAFDPPTFVATVPLVPTVDLGDFESIRVEKAEPKVTDEQVDSVLEQLRQEQSIWEPVDGKVQLDDLIELTVEGWLMEDGERREIVKSENTEYIPREGTRFPVPGFDEGLIGLAQNKLSKFDVDVPADFENQDYAGKKASFEATVHQVKRRRLPDVDDAFAGGVGDGFETVKALREHVRHDLAEREERAVNSIHQDATLTEVVEGATFEMSPMIIDPELEHYVHERQDEFKAGRFTSIEDYQQAIAWQAMTDEEMHEDSRPRVEERLKRAHVLREVAKRQEFESSDEDIDAEVEVMALESGEDAGQIRALFEDVDRRESLGRVLVNRKTLGYLSGIAAQPAIKAPAKKRAAAAKPAATAKAAPVKKSAAPKKKAAPKATTGDKDA
jgi:trigger factor